MLPPKRFPWNRQEQVHGLRDLANISGIYHVGVFHLNDIRLDNPRTVGTPDNPVQVDEIKLFESGINPLVVSSLEKATRP